MHQDVIIQRRSCEFQPQTKMIYEKIKSRSADELVSQKKDWIEISEYSRNHKFSCVDRMKNLEQVNSYANLFFAISAAMRVPSQN